MPRKNLYDLHRVYDLGGRALLRRFAAKQLGGDSFADGRTFEIMFISRMIIDMAAEWFAEDFEGLDPFDLAEGVECLVDDLVTRRGEDVSYYQIKSGRVTDRFVLKDDFDKQQELDALHGFEPLYFLVVTPRYSKGVSDWLRKHDVRCEVVVFPYTTGILGWISLDDGGESTMAWLAGSQRRSAWVSLHRHIVGLWMARRDYSIADLFAGVAQATRFQSPAVLNDKVRLQAFYEILEYYDVYVDAIDRYALTLTAYLEESDWVRIVPCTAEVLDEFDRWHENEAAISTGSLMIWFERYCEEDEVC